MIEQLLLHPTTKQQVVRLVQQPTQSLLLIGSNGIGKGQLATAMAADSLQLPHEEALAAHPYYKHINFEKDSISIDAIRDLQRFLQLKTIGDKPFRRAIVIEHAENLTVEAQNAYLKLLEEPPADTIMLLTVDNQRALLPTILSRVQAITIHAPDETSLKTHFNSRGKQEAAIRQAYFLSGGLLGLMHALLEEDTSHPLLTGVTAAKDILQKTTFERLALVEGLAKQKTEATYTLQALQHMAQTALTQAAGKADAAKVRQWHRVLKLSSEALAALDQNANTKLVLSDLMLRL